MMIKALTRSAAFVAALLLTLTACAEQQDSESKKDTAITSAAQAESADDSNAVDKAEEKESQAEAPTSDEVHDEEKADDIYSVPTEYDLPDDVFDKRDDVDYGTILTDVEYFSTTADDYKQCNILLPAGYDENESYPVMYVIHGWGGNHTNQIKQDSYLTLLYGNMLHDGLTVPQIIVNVDMYTDKQADKESKSDEELRFIYDKVVDDIAVDLMPYIEENFPVKTGRENTAVAGVSQGGAESLTTGFKWLDKFGYISGFAPDPGVIPTDYYKGTFWNTPYFEEFPMPDEDEVPHYLYMTCGTEDPWNLDVTKYYAQVWDEMGLKHQTDYPEGYAHNYKFWRQCFYNYLRRTFTVPVQPKATLGDASGDGGVDVTDISMMAAHIKGIHSLTASALMLADVDRSGKLNVSDIAMTAAHIKGIRALK